MTHTFYFKPQLQMLDGRFVPRVTLDALLPVPTSAEVVVAAPSTDTQPAYTGRGVYDTDASQTNPYLIFADQPKAAPPTSDKLTWDDFAKKDAKPKDGFDAETAAAIHARVEYDWGVANSVREGANITYTVKITKLLEKEFSATFDKTRSYVVKGSETDRLLEHERLHLKLAEYVASKADTNFPEADFLKLTAKVTIPANSKKEDAKDSLEAGIQKEVDKFLDTFQTTWTAITDKANEKYDADTDHSLDRDKQADWVKNYMKYVDEIAKDKGWKK